MGSEANKMNDGTSSCQLPSKPPSCANGCGFFGSADQNDLCSKCFHDSQIQAKAAVDKLVTNMPAVSPTSTSAVEHETVVVQPATAAVTVKVKVSNRCMTCNKKVGVMGFKCKCGDMFCGSHRYPEKHDCEFDFKKTGRDAIAKANPVIVADKLNRI